MGIKTVPQPPYSPDVAACDFCLFHKLRRCRYETIGEMKEAVTKVIDTLTQEDFDGAFQKLLEQYNKCIAAGGDYFEGDKSFMCVLSIKVPIRKKSGNLFNDLRISIYLEPSTLCVCVCVCPKDLRIQPLAGHVLQRIVLCLHFCSYAIVFILLTHSLKSWETLFIKDIVNFAAISFSYYFHILFITFSSFLSQPLSLSFYIQMYE